MSDILEAARALFEDGTPPPDGMAWRGGAPELTFNFSSPEVMRLKTQQLSLPGINDAGRFQMEGDVVFAPTPTTSEAGVVLSGGGSILVQRFLSFYGSAAVQPLKHAFLEAVSRKKSHLTKEVTDWFTGGNSWKVISAFVGFREREDWNNPEKVIVHKVWFGREPNLERGRDLALPTMVKTTVVATKKLAVKNAPFSSMTDHELDRWIDEWASIAPENFWMDGEMRSRSQAMAYWRKAWRAMSPRQQVARMQDIEKWSGGRFAALAQRWLAKQAGANKKWKVYIFSEDGEALFEADFSAFDERDAERKALAIVKPQLPKFPTAEDWVFEPA